MSKTKFSINREKLVEEQGDGYLLTRVPGSNMEYYWLLQEEDIVSDDGKTLVVEWDSEKEVNILPRVQTEEADKSRKPTLKEAIADQQNPSVAIPVKADELYKEYYHYDPNMDPRQKEQLKRERDLKRREALKRSDNARDTKQPEQKNNQESKQQEQNPSAQKEAELSPSQQMDRERANIRHYTSKQFKEIRLGTRQNLDTALYRNINLSHQQMRELRLAMKAGIDITSYNSQFVSAKYMREIRLGAKKGVRLDLEKLDHSLYNADQIHEMRLGFEKELDVKRYLNPSYSAGQMREIRLGLQAGLDTQQLEDLHLTVDQMHSLRMRMIMQNIGDILKKMFEDFRQWLHEKTENVIETLKARYQNREPMTSEQIKEARMEETVEQIKDVAIQSEVIPESAYENSGLDNEIRQSIKQWQEYMEAHPDVEPEDIAKEAAKDICQAANIELEQPEDEKVVDISENRDKENSKTIEQAVEEALGGPEQPQEEIVMEEENWEMIQ